jgi:hypothetical protein
MKDKELGEARTAQVGDIVPFPSISLSNLPNSY